MIRTPITDLGCEQAPAGCEVSNPEDSGIVSSGSATGNYIGRCFIPYKIYSKIWLCQCT